MGILDDAIREHLDLKRKHGARETELREIEDEAFGSGEQPDAFVGGELYTEVGSTEMDAGNEEPTRLVDAEALRPTEQPEEPVDVEPSSESDALTVEPPSEPEALRTTEPPSEPQALRPTEPEPETSDQSVDLEAPSQIPGQAELPGQDEIPGQERLDSEPEEPAPSESLEELIAEEEPFPEDTAAPPPAAEPEPAEAESPGEARPLEPQPDAQAPAGPESHVPDPPPPPPTPGAEPPGRARGRIDVPTQEHPPPGDTGDLPSLPDDEAELGRPDTTYEPPPMDLPDEEPISDEEPLPAEDSSETADGPQLYDFETDEDPVPPASAPPSVDDDFEALGPAEEEAPYLHEEESYSEEPASEVDSDRGTYEEPGTEVRPAIEDEESPERRPSDTEERSFELEEEEGEEDLWFEKGPPKDFDFDDD
ncbi:MAG TPA: hypothetical protein VLB79_10305 [Solirubrobacterales bacterium]|nr:hypothetical protein [Solirubrobacterales bacterium]